jgi:hypothetical protein
MKCEIFVTGVTILLSLTVFLNLVAEKMPSTSDAVPLIGRKWCFPAGRHIDTWRGREDIERLLKRSRFSVQSYDTETPHLAACPRFTTVAISSGCASNWRVDQDTPMFHVYSSYDNTVMLDTVHCQSYMM